MRIPLSLLVILSMCTQLVSCANRGHLEAKKINLHRIEILTPSVMLVDEDESIDSTFTSQYITDHLEWYSKFIGFEYSKNYSPSINLAQRSELLKELREGISKKAPAKRLDLKKFGISPSADKTLLIFHTGAIGKSLSAAQTVGVITASLLFTAGMFVLIPYGAKMVSVMEVYLVNNESQKVEYFHTEQSENPRSRDEIEMLVEMHIDKLISK